MKNKLIILCATSLCSFFSINVLANCPDPSTIVYHCYEMAGHKICSWNPTQGWYQGSGDYSESLKDGDTLPPNSFKRAIWFPYLGDNNGATSCYYQGPEGELVTLFQQTGYGDVPKPTGNNWIPTNTVPNFPESLECLESIGACEFDFAN